MLEKGFICPSKSKICSPLFFVGKKDGKEHPVISYRRLNSITKPDRFPIPLLQEMIDKVQKAKLFSKVDICEGFYNVHVTEGDEWKATLKTNSGLYEPTVMQFGLKNAPAIFQRMMNMQFADIIAQGNVIIYFDDILIATIDDLEVHRRVIGQVLDRLQKLNLYLKPSKCIFKTRRIEFLGVVLENGTVMMDPIKVSGVREWKVPTNTTENHTFQGFANFYRCFIPNFSKIARPLNDLLKTGVKWHWGDEQQKAFKEIKQLIMSEPVLCQPDQTKPFEVKVDASNYAMGAVLMQRDKKNVLHPIAFFSKSMNEAQRNYDIYNKELLGLREMLRHW